MMRVSLQQGVCRILTTPESGLRRRRLRTAAGMRDRSQPAVASCVVVASPQGALDGCDARMCRKRMVLMALRTGAKLPSLWMFVPLTTLERERFVPAITPSPVQGHACAL